MQATSLTEVKLPLSPAIGMECFNLPSRHLPWRQLWGGRGTSGAPPRGFKGKAHSQKRASC